MLVATTTQRRVCAMRSTPVRGRSPRRSRHESGFSLLELLVAILLVDVALLAIAHTHAVVLRQRNETRIRAAAVAAASARIEALLASPCIAAAGSSSLPTMLELWSVQVEGHVREVSDSLAFGWGAPLSHTFVLRTRVPC